VNRDFFTVFEHKEISLLSKVCILGVLTYDDTEAAFWGLLGLSGAMISVVFLLFRRMRWF